MRISRIRLINFANFSDVDVETGESIVIVGENKVGKSNFIRGLQLILDPGLSERDRQLGFEHFGMDWAKKNWGRPSKFQWILLISLTIPD